jgi:hypothetical protein
VNDNAGIAVIADTAVNGNADKWDGERRDCDEVATRSRVAAAIRRFHSVPGVFISDDGDVGNDGVPLAMRNTLTYSLCWSRESP